jgi:hypothetical protein
MILTVFCVSTEAELMPGEYFAVKDEQDPNLEHFIQFSMSLRGKPAILGELGESEGESKEN